MQRCPISTYDFLHPSTRSVEEQLMLQNGPPCNETLSSADENVDLDHRLAHTDRSTSLRYRCTQPSESDFSIVTRRELHTTSDGTRPLLVHTSLADSYFYARNRASNRRGLESLIDSLCVYVQQYCLGKDNHGASDDPRSLASSYEWLNNWIDGAYVVEGHQADTERTSLVDLSACCKDQPKVLEASDRHSHTNSTAYFSKARSSQHENSAKSAFSRPHLDVGTPHLRGGNKRQGDTQSENLPLPRRSLPALSSTCLTVAAGQQAQQRRGPVERRSIKHDSEPIPEDATQRASNAAIPHVVSKLAHTDSCLLKD